VIASPTALSTTVDLPSVGTYVFRLTAGDSELTGTDEVSVSAIGPGGPFTVQVPVATSSDDAEQAAGGGVELASSDLELVEDTTAQTVGLRFAGVQVPHGATISNAYVQFETDDRLEIHDPSFLNHPARGQTSMGSEGIARRRSEPREYSM
jgi:hypothetical protein